MRCSTDIHATYQLLMARKRPPKKIVEVYTYVMEKLLENMWQDYLTLNPLAKKVFDLFEAQGDEVLNDHIALRTYNLPDVGINVLAKHFVDGGYEEKNDYHFEKKKLYAKHYEHSNPKLPKIFISELLVDQLSEFSQKKIHRLVDQMDSSITTKDDFLYSGRPWNLDQQTYQDLLSESEYAGWMAAFGFRPNHFTVNVNNLNSLDDIEDVNKFLKSHGVELNSSGGEVKGNKEVFLKQSSTLANKVEVSFSDGKLIIPSCYYEFAKRFPMENGKLYQGFVAKSADKIFESTDTKK